MSIYITKDGLEKLREELTQLKSVERPKISAAIGEARDKGDLSENAEYDAAKEAQGMLEMKISKLEEKIAVAKIIDPTQIDTSKVNILSKVKLLNLKMNKEITYTLVPEDEVNIKEGKISVSTPIAKGLSGKTVGEIAEIKLPNGNVLELKILEISF